MSESYQPKFSVLSDLIAEATEIIHDPSPAFIRRLQFELENHKEDLLNLLDDPPKNGQHRQKIMNGQAVLNGVNYNVDPLFQEECIFLSDELNIDEYVIGYLLRIGAHRKARYYRSSMETAVLLYHRERYYLLQCLERMFKSIGDEDIPPMVRALFQEFTDDLIQARPHFGSATGGGSGTFTQKILKTADTLKSQVMQLMQSGRLSSSQPIPVGTQLPSGRPALRMSEDILVQWVKDLNQERRMLGQILFHISYQCSLNAEEIIALEEMLIIARLSDPVLPHLLIALLASIDSAKGIQPEKSSSLAKDKNFVAHFSATLDREEWLVKPLRAVVKLQWALFLISPSDSHGAHYSRDLGISDASQDHNILAAIQADAFQFIIHYILGFRLRDTERKKKLKDLADMMAREPGGSVLGGNAMENELVENAATVDFDEEFQPYVYFQLELMITHFIQKCPHTVRKLKNLEEDIATSSTAAHRSGLSAPPIHANRKDLEALFTLITMLYRDRENAGETFWNDRVLHGFLKVGLDNRDSSGGLARTYLDMLGALATGDRCAQHAYNLLADNYPSSGSNRLTWTKLFMALSFYGTELRKALNSGTLTEILPPEVALLKSFLKLLSIVVYYSHLARTTLYENQQFKVLFTLMDLLTTAVSVDLKAALFDTIASFCAPGGDAGGEIAKQVWGLLEQAQVLRTVPRGIDHMLGKPQDRMVFGVLSQAPPEGILFEVEEIESKNETYPETLAFVKLLKTMIHIPVKDITTEYSIGIGSPSIPDNLGTGYRVPGITPYVSFVIDHVLLKAHLRGYSYPEEKWEIIDASLELLERCLVTFNLDWQASGGGSGNSASIAAATVHPGFDVMARLLSNSKLLDEIFRVISFGIDAVNENAFKTVHFRTSVMRSLRILLRVFAIQGLFIDFLVPAVMQQAGSNGLSRPLLPVSLSRIDQLLLYRKNVVIHIALFVNCFRGGKICLLAAQIMTALSNSFYFAGRDRNMAGGNINRLAALVNQSDESIRILHGFIERVENDTAGEHDEDPKEVQRVLEELYAETDESIQMDNTVQLAILDLFLSNISAPEKVSPTIAHFLLGYNMKGPISETEIMDSEVMNVSMNCFHIILKLLREGINNRTESRDVNMDAEDVFTSAPLFIRHPLLAERCYHLIYMLCADGNTSSPTMRYLRNRENFFLNQFRAMPVRIETRLTDDPDGEIIGSDNSRIKANYTAILVELHRRYWLLATVALELHVTTTGGMSNSATELLKLMFLETIDGQPLHDGEEDIDGTGMSRNNYAKSRFEQPLMKMLEILNSLDFVWKDRLRMEAFDSLYYFADVYQAVAECKKVDERGCEIFDINAIHMILLTRQNQLEVQGSITSAANRQAMKIESMRLIDHFTAENNSLRLEHAKRLCLQAWKQVMEITLSRCFDLIPGNMRESILYDFLMALLPKLSAIDGATSEKEVLSGVVLTLMTRLRQDRYRQAIVQGSLGTDLALPVDRLHTILRGIVESIQQTDTSIFMRGNLYTTLMNYFQFTSSKPYLASSTLANIDNEGMGTVDTMIVGINSLDNRSSGLYIGNINIITASGDRLLDTICRDASDGLAIWKTAAFTVLDSLCVLVKREKVNRVLQFLLSRNFLRHFIENLRNEDAALQKLVLDFEIESLNPLFIYQTKMALFLRLAQRRDGAEKLVENGILGVLSDCQFLNERPDQDVGRQGLSTFLPPATERYHDLLMPALQLIVGIMSTFGRESTMVVNKVITWTSCHQDVLMAILKDNAPIVTLSSLHQLKLTTALFYQLSTRAEVVEFLSGQSMNQYHLLLLSLMPKYFNSERWSMNLQPVSDDEREKARITPKDWGRQNDKSVFRREADIFVADILKNLLAYSQNMIESNRESASKTFKPVFVWTIAAAKEKDHSAGQIAKSATPSLATLANLIRNITEQLSVQLGEHSAISYKSTHLSLDELPEIDFYSRKNIAKKGLTPSQRLQLGTLELEYIISAKAKEILSSLFILEHGLLLLLSHLQFYFGSTSVDTFPSSIDVDTRAAVRSRGFQPAVGEVDALKTDSKVVLQPILQKLGEIELSKETVGLTYQTRSDYLQMLVRMLRDLLSRA